MLNKNDIVTLTITDFTTAGEGVGHVDGYALFVKDAVVGDTVTVKVMKCKKNYGYARLMEILSPSPERVEPRCAQARACGGCTLMALSYEKQLEFKNRLVAGNLTRIGGIDCLSEQSVVQLPPVIGMDNPYRYRNKAQFPVGTDREGHIVMGFYAGRTHSIIPCEDCQIGSTLNREILRVVREYMEDNRISAYNEEEHKGLVRHILIREGFSTGELMVCLIINGKQLPKEDKLVEALTSLDLESVTEEENACGGIDGKRQLVSIMVNVNTQKTNVILGDTCRVLWGRGYIEDSIADVKFRISPLSFYQVNPIQTKRLYDTAIAYAGLTGEETVWDLYCGIGTISLSVAQKAKAVYGVEIVPQAIEDANNNAQLNGITNVHFYVGKAEEVGPRLYHSEGIHADVVIVDPPRKGCDETLLSTMVEMTPKRIVYVSCDSATLARDVKFLSEHGYVFEKAQAVDMFSHSCHVESVCLLSKVQE